MESPRPSIRLPVALLARLRSFARAHRISLSAVVRLALHRGLTFMEADAAGRGTGTENVNR